MPVNTKNNLISNGRLESYLGFRYFPGRLLLLLDVLCLMLYTVRPITLMLSKGWSDLLSFILPVCGSLCLSVSVCLSVSLSLSFCLCAWDEEVWLCIEGSTA